MVGGPALEQQNNELHSFQGIDFSGKMKDFSTQRNDPKFVPELKNNLKKDEENKFLKVGTEQTKTSEAQKVFKKRIAEIDKELENMVITPEYRNELESEKKNLPEISENQQVTEKFEAQDNREGE